jgi:two-component system, cell cycle response regulator DivK
MVEYPRDLLSKWSVVVVEDEDDSLDIATYILEYYGAIVYSATNGKDGLRLVRSVLPRFVISDLSMPVMDGWEMIRELQRDSHTRDIPVIALTAHAMRGDRERAIAAGFYNYLTKPLTADMFMHDLVTLLVENPEFREALLYT